MTTNHRPTLEAKRGKAQNIQDSISHSRALPQQRSLKYRNDINIEDARAAVQELKEESRVRKQPFEGKVEKKRKLEESAKTPVAVTPKDETGEKESEDLEDSHSEYSSDDDDDDDETAQLMQELQKIKQEREELKQKLQDKSKQERAISSNPLLQLDSSAAPVKKAGDHLRHSEMSH